MSDTRLLHEHETQPTQVKGVGTFHVPSTWNPGKGVGTFHVPSTWNPGESVPAPFVGCDNQRVLPTA